MKHWCFLVSRLHFTNFLCTLYTICLGEKKGLMVFSETLVFEMIFRNSFLAAKSISILELTNCFWKCFLRCYFWKWHWVNPVGVWEKELEMIIKNRLRQYSWGCKIDSNISLRFCSLLCQGFSTPPHTHTPYT